MSIRLGVEFLWLLIVLSAVVGTRLPAPPPLRKERSITIVVRPE